MEIKLVIFVVIVVAVLLFMYIRKNSKNTATDASIELGSAQKIPSEAVAVEPIEVSNSAEAVAREEGAVKEPEASVIKGVAIESRSVPGIPEDSALRRHFIQQLTAEIEATLPVRPSDSTLKRHYDAQLLSLVSSNLDALK